MARSAPFDVQVVENWGVERSLSSRLNPWSRLAREDGIIALETLFSMMLIFFMTFIFYTLSAALHNQAVMNGATQLAAQESIMAYDRLAYRTESPTRQQVLQGQITQIATDVYQESARGLLAGFGSAKPSAQPISFPNGQPLACGSDYVNFSPGNCGTGDGGRIEQLQVEGTAPMSLSFLGSIVNLSSGSQASASLHAIGVAYSAGPCARTPAGAQGC
jgi:hypothetical protein